MRRLSGSEIRRTFLQFFQDRGHTVVPSSSLVPKADPTLLFTNAGMVQFKEVFLGRDVRSYTRATSAQKCVRAGGKHNDLENVGRTARHHTFFEMLGNFSFGDYFKEGAITYAWEFLTTLLALPPQSLWATVYTDDDEAVLLWQKIAGLPEERVVRLGEKENFWAMGDTGPCGPCSELVIDQGPGVGCGRPECDITCGCDRFLELWNLVFMQYNRDSEGRVTPLPRPSIDTGAGLERLAAVLQGVHSNFDSDLFQPVIQAVEEAAGRRYGEESSADVSFRVVADHARAVTFLISDGVLPSNEGRGYVLRRILRRALRHGKLLGIEEPFLSRVTGRVVDLMAEPYPELTQTREHVARVTLFEEERFAATLRVGLSRVEELFATVAAQGQTQIPGREIFRLYDTYGFPQDLLQELAQERGFTLDGEGFSREMEEQRARAKASWVGSGEVEAPPLYRELAATRQISFVGYQTLEVDATVLAVLQQGRSLEGASEGDEAEVVLDQTPFYPEGGGQVGDRGSVWSSGLLCEVRDTQSPLPGLIVHAVKIRRGSLGVGMTVHARVEGEMRRFTTCNHTATHLLHSTLRLVLGDHVKQAGSLVAPDRLRFDFTHFTPVRGREISRVEEIVNEKIQENIAVSIQRMELEEALRRGALALFGERYGTTVRVVEIPQFSQELCGGTHVEATGDIGVFTIVDEGSVAAGVRRIEALTGREALTHLKREEGILHTTASVLKSRPTEVAEKVERLITTTRELEKEVQHLKSRLASSVADDLLAQADEVKGVPVIRGRLDLLDPRALRELADQLRNRLRKGVIVLASVQGGKVSWLCTVSSDLTKRLHAGKIVQELAALTGGGGGGRPDLAEAGGKDPARVDQALAALSGIVGRHLGAG